MFEFVLTYYNRSVLAPPLSLIEHCYSLTLFIYEKTRCRGRSKEGVNVRKNSPFVFYGEDLVDDIDASGVKMSTKRKVYQLEMLTRFETSAIETFQEEQQQQQQQEKDETMKENSE